MISQNEIIEHYIQRLDKGWEIRLKTQDGIQIVKAKRVNMLGFWVGLLLMPFWGLGFIFWLLVLIDYLFQREKVIFVSVSEMVKQLKEAK